MENASGILQSTLDEAASITRRFAREELLPKRALLEKQGGAPDANGVPLIDAMRALGSQLGLSELARDAAIDATAHEGIFLGPALGARLLGELTRALPGFALSFGASMGLCGQSILRRGTEAQRAEWARPVLAFEKIGCWALTEPEAGSDAFSLRTRARRISDRIDGWELSGEKCFITNAPIADTFVIFARIDEPGGKLDGQIRSFLLARGDRGLTTSAPLEKMGMRASPTGSIALDAVRVPLDRLLGDPDESGKRAALETLLFERAGLSAMALAIVEESLQLALAWAKERKQFGQPIAQFQAVQLRLAKMYAAQETIRALVEQGNRLFERGESTLAWLCAAKYTASTLATEAAMDAVQILGGTGYCTDARVEGFARDAKLLEIGGGTSDIQLLAVARELLKM